MHMAKVRKYAAKTIKEIYGNDMNRIENQKFDEERALYGSTDLMVCQCSFDGPADGESALKECSNITAEDCFYNLRYPFWHVRGLQIHGGEMPELCRAALWYSEHVEVTDLNMYGIKALRECADVTIRRCDIRSPEFGWSTRGITMEDTTAVSEYFMMRSEDLHFRRVDFTGKYSFQYIRNAVFENCTFSTKDAFWHGENITVRDSVIRGEYLAWYADGLTLENCTLIGTQPFCYCRNLRLINCEMIDCDLAFEKSDVEATVTTPVISIKNPLSGHITVPAVGEIIRDDSRSGAEITITRK